VLDGRAPGLELGGRVRVRRLQPPLRDLQEPRRARVERLRGQRLEPLGQLGVHQCRSFLHHLGPLLGGAGSPDQVRQPPAGEQVPDHGPDDDPEDQAGKQRHDPSIGSTRPEPRPRHAGDAGFRRSESK